MKHMFQVCFRNHSNLHVSSNLFQFNRTNLKTARFDLALFVSKLFFFFEVVGNSKRKEKCSMVNQLANLNSLAGNAVNLPPWPLPAWF